MAKEQKKERKQIIILGILILIFSISAIFTKPISNIVNSILFKANINTSYDGMLVHYINVGQGDAMAINLPNGEIMLIDSGPKDSQNNLIEYIKTNVMIGNDLIVDYLVLTHSDIDHCGGMSAIFAEFKVKNFYRPNIACSSESADDYMIKTDVDEYDKVINNAKNEHGLDMLVANQQFEFWAGEVLIQIFPPVDVYYTANEMSSVVKLTHCNKSFLFTGDIGGDSEQDMIIKYGNKLDCDVLKVAHHGSKNSTSQDFIDIVTPKYAVICVGQNFYGHPHFTTVSKLEQSGAQVLTTKNGAIRILSNNGNLLQLDENIAYSTLYIHWWGIALVVDLILMGMLAIVVVKIILRKRKETQLMQ